MFNAMNGVSATEKLGLGPEVRELKFGSSFTGGNKSQGGSFHTIRYDFKPASVDTTKMATVDVGTNSQVTITVPHSDGAGTNVFKGARKPYAKECVLIIDQETGEVVLEKLTHNIQVKKTRQEGGSRQSKGGAPAPAPQHNPMPSTTHSMKADPKSSKSSGSSSSSQGQQSNAMRRTPNSPMLPMPSRQSPLGPSPNRQSPHSPPLMHVPPQPLNKNSSSAAESFDNLLKTQSTLPSLTSIEDLLAPAAMPARPPPVMSNVTPVVSKSKDPPPPSATADTLSESSSGEDSSSSSSSDDGSSSSDDEMEVVPDPVPVPIKAPVNIPVPVSRSMPSVLLDLQLSESGSESD